MAVAAGEIGVVAANLVDDSQRDLWHGSIIVKREGQPLPKRVPRGGVDGEGAGGRARPPHLLNALGIAGADDIRGQEQMVP